MNRPVNPNQGSFEVIEPEPIRVNLSARNAFGRVPFVEYFDLDPAIFNEITPHDENLVDPQVIEPQLYKATAHHTIKRSYPNGGWVVLSPSEYATIPASAGQYAERVSARSVASRDGLIKDLDVKIASAKRAGAHALQKSVVPKLRNFVEGYNAELEDLRWLKSEIPQHYFAHTTEAKMRVVTHTVLESFLNTIDTISSAHDWNADKTETAKLALQKRLLAGRGGGTLEPKKTYWSDMIAVSGNHIIAKKSAVASRVYEAQYIIDCYLR